MSNPNEASSTTEQNKLNIEDLKFIKRNTNINQKKILENYESFLKRYSNGVVNREEFNKLIKQLLIIDLPDQLNEKEQKEIEKEKFELCERLFDICDIDDDGYIDFKEYLVLFWTRVNGNNEDKLSLIFDMVDSNHSGYLDFHELHSIVKILYKLKNVENNENLISDDTTENDSDKCRIMFYSTLPKTYHVSMNIMKKFDTDKNGKLSKKEFINGCLNHDKIRQFLTPIKYL